MLNIVIIQRVVPSYSGAFFNELALNLKGKAIVHVIADYDTRTTLNQAGNYDDFHKVNFRCVDLKGFNLEIGLRKLILSCKPDIVIFGGNSRSLLSIPIMLYLKFKGVKLFSWGMFHRIGRSRFSSNLMFWLYASLSNKTLCYGRTGARQLLAMGLKPESLKVIGTAIDESKPLTEAVLVDKKCLNNIIVKYNLICNKIVLQVVRLSSIKKPLILIEVAKILVSKDPEYKFLLVGDGELKKSVYNLIREYKLENNVYLLGPVYSESELAKLYTISTVFVMPTCIGLSAHHAMAYSLPIVTDDSLAFQASEFDILSNGLNSLTYKEGDVKDFSRKISYVCENPSFREFLSKNALQTVKVHSLNKKVNNFIEYVLG